MIPIEAEKALKQKILSKRKQMIGMSSDIHWCKIHSEVRAVLEEGYLKLGVEQLSTITGFKEESIKVWMAQAQFVKDLSGRVDACKRDGRMVNSMSILIRTDVCRLARIIGLRAASAATGVARSSITTWLNLGFDAEATYIITVPRMAMVESQSHDGVSTNNGGFLWKMSRSARSCHPT